MFLTSLVSRGGAPGLAALALIVSPAAAQTAGPATGALINGTIDLLELTNPADVYSGGRMVVGGQVIILPRNLLIDLPANRLTLQQLFADAPPDALAEGKSGLATLDGTVGKKAVALVLGNRTAFGNVIAGEVLIEKGPEAINGRVTFIDHTAGYLRIDGIVGDNTTGLMVRINDPEGRHTIQSGAGCDGGPNCSADVRFGLDPDNYTIVYTTGYPAGIPSTVPAGQRAGFRAGDNAAAAADAAGVGDPFCPTTNRAPIVPNSTLFAPIRVGDNINAEGNFEDIGGVHFLSAHSLKVFDRLFTQDTPSQPDYIIWEEVEWDVPAFNNERQRLLLIGFSTLPNSQVDVFSLHKNRTTGADVEFPLGSTVGNPDTILQGIGGTAGGIFKIRYVVDFVDGAGLLGPCTNLRNAGFNVCPNLSLAEEFAILNPISRELMGRSRRTLNPGVITRDINGNESPNGQYLTPVGIGHPEFGEIDLGAFATPFAFDGLPWNLDRRLGPGGPGGGTVQQLDPFPFNGNDPALRAPIRNEVFAFFPFGPTNVLAWPPVAPASFPILPTPIPQNVGPAPAPAADFITANGAGTVPLTVTFTDASTGNVNARLWDFGDGSFSILQNPVHTFLTVGTFSVSLTALGQGGVDVETKLGLVSATTPGGPGAPTAAFSQDRTAGNIPLTVNFTNLTTGDATSFLWNFGDGATSTTPSPSHVYTVAGLYTVTLTATGPGGTNVVSRVDAVRANTPGAVDIDFRGTPRSGAAPLIVRFRTQVLAGGGTGITGTWDFGDGSTAAANGQDILHTYANPGSYTVTLTASNGTATDIEQKVGYITVAAPLVIR